MRSVSFLISSCSVAWAIRLEAGRCRGIGVVSLGTLAWRKCVRWWDGKFGVRVSVDSSQIAVWAN